MDGDGSCLEQRRLPVGGLNRPAKHVQLLMEQAQVTTQQTYFFVVKKIGLQIQPIF